jgi:hypothetical protein
VAVQKNSRNKSPPSRKKPVALLFWVFFCIFIVSLYFINREKIRETMEVTHFMDHLLNRSPADEAPPGEPDLPGGIGFVPREDLPGPDDWELPPEVPLLQEPPAPGEAPVAGESFAGEKPGSGEAPPLGEASSPQPEEGSQELPVSSPPIPEPERRNRSLYFMRLDRDGTVVRTITSRSLAVSPSPLADTLQALLQGPTAEERQQGMVSFIPPGTRILDIRIRGTTAYINFSEEFQFGIFGAEGYAAQLRQIVWTATEFSTVKDVQILIEGRVVNFLGESILIGSPISREAMQ